MTMLVRVLLFYAALLAFLAAAGLVQAQTLPHSGANHLQENASQNWVTVNDMGDRLDEANQNHLSIGMLDANVTLTDIQQWESAFIELTGANTAIRDLILNGDEKRLVVWNNTTGGFDVRVKYATGGTVNVSPGLVVWLQGDGTDIIQAGSLDIAQLTTESLVDGTSDLFVMWDSSVQALRAVLGDNLPGGSGGGGGAFGAFSGALVTYTTASEPLGAEVPEYIDWDAQTFDTDDFWESATNPSRFTIPSGVTKVMTGGVGLFSGSGDRIRMAVHKNGSATEDCNLHSMGQGAGTDGLPFPICVLPVTGGDFLQVEVIHSGTSASFDNGYWWIMVVDPVPVSRVSDNQLVNGDFQVCQRQAGGCTFTSASTFTNADASYGLDRWVHLCESSDCTDYGRETTVVPGAPGATTALKSETETANEKFGWVQILPSDRSKRLIGGTASLSWKMRSTTGLQVANVRAAVLCWTGTADSVTRDVVATWGTPGTNPTFATNWTAENTPADIAVTLDAYATAKIENISVDTASCNNVAAFIWVDEDTAVNDLLYITDVQLEPSSLASGYQRQDFEQVLRESERHYRKSHPVGTTVAQNAGTAGAISYHVDRAGTVNDGVQVFFGQTMFASPTITFFNPSAANALWRRVTAAADCGAASAVFTSAKGFFARAAQCAAAAVGNDMAVHWSAAAEL